MSETPFTVWLGGTRSAMVVCTILLLAVGLARSPAAAQSDVRPDAPWQAHPCEGQWVPPANCPSCCGDDCHDTACGEHHAGCDDECSVTDWCRWPIFEPCGQLSFRGEYLGWWTKSSPLPALATTSPATTPRAQAGVIGQPETEILFAPATAIRPFTRAGDSCSVTGSPPAANRAWTSTTSSSATRPQRSTRRATAA